MWHHACTSACPTSIYYDSYAICVAMTSVVLTVVLALICVLRLVKPRANDKRQKAVINIVYALSVSRRSLVERKVNVDVHVYIVSDLCRAVD